MRISANTLDPAFSPLAANASIFLDGLPLSCCVTADDVLGEAICLVFDQENKPVMNEFGEIKTVKVRGKIEIRIVQ